MKVIDYCVVSSANESENDLTNIVNKLIEADWQPLGAPIISKASYFYQAMVKYAGKK